MEEAEALKFVQLSAVYWVEGVMCHFAHRLIDEAPDFETTKAWIDLVKDIPCDRMEITVNVDELPPDIETGRLYNPESYAKH